MRDFVLDWAATAASTAGVFASLIVFDGLQRVALPFGSRAHQKMVSGMATGINRAARLSGASVRREGLSNVDPSQSYIIVSNHQSLLDISLASEILADLQPRYVSKIELARGIPGVSYNLRRGGSVCIDRKNPAQAHSAIEDIARRVATEGISVVIFPEGTRSKNGAMKPFHHGGLRTILKHAPNVPVLPLTVYGGSRLFRNNLKPIVRNVELGFVVHPPRMAPPADDDAQFLPFVDELYRVIESALPERDRLGQA